MKKLLKLKNFIKTTVTKDILLAGVFIIVGIILIIFGVKMDFNDRERQLVKSITDNTIAVRNISIPVVEVIPETVEQPILEEHPILLCEEIAEEMPKKEDVELLAHLIMGEAGSDYLPDEMLFYVGSVVLNRVDHDRFPDTLEGVIFQSGQYACTWDGNFDKEPTERCYIIAEDLLRNGSILPEDVVFQAQFIQGSEVYEQIGNTYFCRL